MWKSLTLTYINDSWKKVKNTDMRRITDTELVRNYYEKHNGDIFDINYASEHIFKDIPHVNLRKIVSRLIDSGLLRTIS